MKLPIYELRRLWEIRDAMSREFSDERRLEMVGTVAKMNEGFNLAGYYVKNICKFCKRIPEFTCLQLSDQILILKPFFFDILAVRYAFTYDPETDGFPMAEVENLRTWKF